MSELVDRVYTQERLDDLKEQLRKNRELQDFQKRNIAAGLMQERVLDDTRQQEQQLLRIINEFYPGQA